jgi:hypothetical protein
MRCQVELPNTDSTAPNNGHHSCATDSAAEEEHPMTITLSQPLQALAEQYLAARQRSGEALLEAAQALAEARALAKHGEWYRFLQLTRTSASTAERLLNIYRLASENLQFAGFVRDNWVGVSVAGLLARPSTPTAVIAHVTTGQIAPTMEAVQNAIDSMNAQLSAPQPDPAEQPMAAEASSDAIDDEIRNAQMLILRGIWTTAPALALLQQKLPPEVFEAVLREEQMDRALADVLIGCAANPPQSLGDLPDVLLVLFLPWAIRKRGTPTTPEL